MRPARELADLIASKLPLGSDYVAGFVESAIVNRDREWQQKVDRLIDALQSLVDEQNGPPLFSRQNQWRAAFNRAKDAIKEEGA